MATQAMDRSRGGLTTKVMALTSRTGRFIQVKLKPGNTAEASGLLTLRNGIPFFETSELMTRH